MNTAYATELTAMLREIDQEYRLTRGMTGKGELSARVRRALAQTPRHAFVPPDLCRLAYQNRPLPIGHGQTISQPFIVALMTDLLDPQPGHRLLEVGCGCGYQAAILSLLAEDVYSTEIVPDLAQAARQRLDRLGFKVTVGEKDGAFGWPEHAPFDGIIVTAAAVSVPPLLLEQLQPGGRLIIPVGEPYGFQRLLLFHKINDGTIEEEEVLGVAFVPLTGFHGQG